MGILAVNFHFLPSFFPKSPDPVPHVQPYRSRTLGSQTLNSILAKASSNSKPKIDKIYLHVQVSNEGAKRFYERHGFQQIEIHKNYYKKIEPRDAWVLEKSFS